MREGKYAVLRFEVSPTLKQEQGALVVIEPDPRIDGGLVAKVDPSFCKIAPELAAEELSLAFALFKPERA